MFVMQLSEHAESDLYPKMTHSGLLHLKNLFKMFATVCLIGVTEWGVEERDREERILLFHFSNSHNNQGLASEKPGGWNSILCR